MMVDSVLQIPLDARKSAAKLVCKCRKEVSGRAASRVFAREKERPSESFFDYCVLCHFETSHPLSYSECNNRFSNTRYAMQPDELIILSAV
jgi:hypothetical protein